MRFSSGSASRATTRFWDVKELLERLEGKEEFEWMQSRVSPRAWRDQTMLGLSPYVANSIKIRDESRRDTEYTPKCRMITVHGNTALTYSPTKKPSQSKLPTANFKPDLSQSCIRRCYRYWQAQAFSRGMVRR
jgi:hypothetical protein